MKKRVRKRLQSAPRLRWTALVTAGLIGVAVLLANPGIPSALAAEKKQPVQPQVITIAGMTYSPTKLKAHIG
ncbi:MAG TPA: hypothetical protein VIM69_04355, partial [Opitutaceae bacterium]